MAPKKAAEVTAARLTEMLTADPTFAPFLQSAGSNALKLINAVLFAATDGQTLLTMTDHNGRLVGFAVRPGNPVAESDTHGFLPVANPAAESTLAWMREKYPLLPMSDRESVHPAQMSPIHQVEYPLHPVVTCGDVGIQSSLPE